MENGKKVAFVFSAALLVKNQKNLTLCFFSLDFCWKTKNLGKPKNPKVSGPSKGFGFWIFGSLSLRANAARSM